MLATTVQKSAGRRRLSNTQAVEVTANLLTQPIDVDVSLEKHKKRQMRHLPGYAVHGLSSGRDVILDAMGQGIDKFVLRLSDSGAKFDYRSCVTRTERLAEAFYKMRGEVGRYARLTVDPFAVALNPDGRWGVPTEGGINYEKTTELLEKIGSLFAAAGADALVTLGRLDVEVEACRHGIDRVGGVTILSSFSANSETSTAYIYLDHSHDTGQKIFPGNINEMLLWSLCDIWNGTEIVLVKPLENLHVSARLSDYIRDPHQAIEFIKSYVPQDLALISPAAGRAVAEIRKDPEEFARRLRSARIGAYAVSGTTFMLSLLADRCGVDQTIARLREMWLEVLAALGDQVDSIIDRNAASYLRGQVLH